MRTTLTMDELSDYMRISRSTLCKLAPEGRVPGQKVGRYWRFQKEAIDSGLERSDAGDSGAGGGMG